MTGRETYKILSAMKEATACDTCHDCLYRRQEEVVLAHLPFFCKTTPLHFRQNAAFSGGKDAPQIKKVQAGRMCRAS